MGLLTVCRAKSDMAAKHGQPRPRARCRHELVDLVGKLRTVPDSEFCNDAKPGLEASGSIVASGLMPVKQ